MLREGKEQGREGLGNAGREMQRGLVQNLAPRSHAACLGEPGPGATPHGGVRFVSLGSWGSWAAGMESDLHMASTLHSTGIFEKTRTASPLSPGV